MKGVRMILAGQIHLDNIAVINHASSPAVVPAGQSGFALDGPPEVRVVLHPRGSMRNGVTSRTWLRCHNRLPTLQYPDRDDPRETTELTGLPGDVFCIVAERSVPRRRQAILAIAVVEIQSERTALETALVRLPGIDRPVSLLAHLSSAAAERFMIYLEKLERQGVELASVRPVFWTRLAAALEARVLDADLPWPDDDQET